MTDLRNFRYRTSYFLVVLTLVDKTNHRCVKRAEFPTSLKPKTATANDPEAATFDFHPQSVTLCPRSFFHVIFSCPS